MSGARLFGARALRMCASMRAVILPLLLSLAPFSLALAAPAMAQAPKPAPKPATPTVAPGPKSIGVFEDWQAATHIEAGQPVCYAFTKTFTPTPAIAGRGDVVLTVTQRQSGRDAVALSAGFEYAVNAAVEVQIDQTKIEFYTAKRSAFARDGHAVVVALQKAQKVVARSPHPQKTQVTDNFSLKGFAKAYEAITKACPPK